MASYRKRNDKWQVVVTFKRDRVTGKQNTRSRSFPTKRQGEQWARRTERERDRGATGLGDHSTVAGIAEAWLTTQWERVAADDLAPNTYKWYESAIEGHVASTAFGRLPVRSVTAKDIARFYQWKRESGRLDGRGGLGEGSVRGLHIVLGSVFRWAVAQKTIDSNPVDGLPAVPKTRRTRTNRDNVWTVEDLRTFLTASVDARLASA